MKKTVIALSLSCLMLTGCARMIINEYQGITKNAPANEFSDVSWTPSVATESATSDESFEYTAPASTASGRSEAEIVKNTMMVAKTANVNVDVGNIEEFNDNITKKVDELGGYFESSEIQNYDNDYSQYRYANYRIRIPAEKLDTFFEAVEGQSNITNKTITSDDISLDYVDTKAHISALEAEKTNLERLLEGTENVSEIIEIEDRLATVQADLDSYNGQKRLLEGRVDYSTIHLQAREERNIDHPIRKAFEINFAKEMVEGIERSAQTFVAIITGIPVFIVILFFASIFIWIIRKIWKKIFKTDKGIKYVLMPVAMSKEGKVPRPSRKKQKEIVEDNYEEDYIDDKDYSEQQFMKES